MFLLRKFPVILVVGLAPFVIACTKNRVAMPTPTEAIVAAATIPAPTDQPAVKASPTPLVLGDPCELDSEVCIVGREIEHYMQTSDTTAIVDLAEQTPFTCPDPTVLDQLAITVLICEAAFGGEVRYGFVVSGLQSEVRAFDELGYTEWLTRKLEQVGSDNMSVAVGCPLTENRVDCREVASIVLVNQSEPQLLVHFTIRRIDGIYRVVHSTSGVVRLNREMVIGGIVDRRLDGSSAQTIYLPVE